MASAPGSAIVEVYANAVAKLAEGGKGIGPRVEVGGKTVEMTGKETKSYAVNLLNALLKKAAVNLGKREGVAGNVGTGSTKEIIVRFFSELVQLIDNNAQFDVKAVPSLDTASATEVANAASKWLRVLYDDIQSAGFPGAAFRESGVATGVAAQPTVTRTRAEPSQPARKDKRPSVKAPEPSAQLTPQNFVRSWAKAVSQNYEDAISLYDRALSEIEESAAVERDVQSVSAQITRSVRDLNRGLEQLEASLPMKIGEEMPKANRTVRMSANMADELDSLVQTIFAAREGAEVADKEIAQAFSAKVQRRVSPDTISALVHVAAFSGGQEQGLSAIEQSAHDLAVEANMSAASKKRLSKLMLEVGQAPKNSSVKQYRTKALTAGSSITFKN